MTPRPIPAVRRALVALASLALILTALPGTVLCVGSNGHLALEAIGSECVAPAAVPAPAHDLAMLAPALHGCTDTPLGAPSLRSASDPSQATHWAVAHVVKDPAVGRGATAATVALRSAPPLPPPFRLSTVLLL